MKAQLEEDVDVEVEDGLAGAGAVVHDEAGVGEAGLAGDVRRDEQQVPEQRLVAGRRVAAGGRWRQP